MDILAETGSLTPSQSSQQHLIGQNILSSPQCTALFQRAGIQCLLSVPWVIVQSKQNDHHSTEKKKCQILMSFDKKQTLYHVFIQIFSISKSWLELTPISLVPLATLKSKVLPIQLAQDTTGSQKCCL